MYLALQQSDSWNDVDPFGFHFLFLSQTLLGQMPEKRTIHSTLVQKHRQRKCVQFISLPCDPCDLCGEMKQLPFMHSGLCPLFLCMEMYTSTPSGHACIAIASFNAIWCYRLLLIEQSSHIIVAMLLLCDARWNSWQMLEHNSWSLPNYPQVWPFLGWQWCLEWNV